jgi:hypothetical protein
MELNEMTQEMQEALVFERALRAVAVRVCSYNNGAGLLQLLRLPKGGNAVVLAPNVQRLDWLYGEACRKADAFILAANQTRRNFLVQDGAMVWFKVADMTQLAGLRFDVAMLAT